MDHDAPTPPEAPPDEVESLPKAIGALFADLPGLLSDRVHLLSLELRRASNALGQMVALGLLAAILFATAWITLWIGLAEAFLAVGLKWPWIVLLVLFVNLSAAVWALMRVKALAPLLALPATLRRLTDSDAFERREESDSSHG
ncbi:phage holin family protein [Scleromatobacter humisilvae]|uniref:Phage holin family protein n=1 Tax=Scleromatobacter humisilvae TaxID=2897159 RepID=A0A9X1YKQ0_9BURK|nr:phage holin family protein [Scleromatobacter humisilvae]MCK9686137.1 phage holin family protein [Scleromatobacter humisilvae]